MDTSNIENTKPNNSELLVVGADLGKSSLQNSFLKFREQKIKEKNLIKACRDAAANGGRSAEYKAALRQKFVDGAMKYIGVPYGIKYKKEEDPVAPLYLDCCGLVRKVVQDLQEEFGFVIGKWNQAYQMDTLPVVLEFEQLKPGDLIFYEGNYVSDRSKKQKHNNVHVEIYLGGETGEATVGSRFHKGSVSVFPSYNFTSTTWTLVKHHFRSLDTWLDGICMSYCSEHPWQSDSLNYVDAAGRRSIFNSEYDGICCENAEAECDDADCEPGGDDGDGEEVVAVEKTESFEEEVLPRADIHAQIQSHRNNNFQEMHDGTMSNHDANGLIKKTDSIEEVTSEMSKAVTKTASSDVQSDSDIGGKSCDDAEKSSRRVRGVVISSKEVSAKDMSTKRPKRISQYSAAPGAPNSSGGIATAGAANTSECVKSGKMSRSQSKLAAAPAAVSGKSSASSTAVTEFSCAKSTKEGPRCYYLGKTNGWRSVKAAMDRRGWTMMPTEYHFSTRYGFKWVERRNQIDYVAHIPGQLVCHIPNNDVITTKIGMLCTLRDKFCRQPGTAARIHPPWLPHTYDLESPADCIAIIQEEDRITKSGGLPVASAAVEPPKSPVPNRTQNGSDDEGGMLQPPVAPIAPSGKSGKSGKKLTVENLDDEEYAGEAGSEIPGFIWIYKPSCTNRGRGIRVLAGLPALKELVCGKPMGGDEVGSSGTSIPFKGIIQKYLRRPLLVTDQGCKFDVRCYLLIARNHPTTLAFYHPGYCRLALKPYCVATPANLEDNSVHLTNAAIQKKEAIYKEDDNKELQIQTVESVADNLESLGKSESADFLRNELDHHIKLCMVDVLKASNHILLKKHGYFDLLGCDFMLSERNKVFMLEMNTNPSLTLDNSTLAAMLPPVVDGAIELVMQSQGPDRRPGDGDEFLKSELPNKWQLIMDEGTGYMYKGSKNKSSKNAKST